ncbi:MAG: bifunctional UDP-3-O-[3-hydroxymyristoyl] N-acetylglucosamine deacetylase/3-hydroxyacyl-ACP dehydratase [Bacteroidales bacterium]|nr:bifunctional UDP-3-O-[3-hydroxymyristoyl] N-acetylglucosamine deacetylase/3-hydroxyacyl-ACP dehydratase [Bacteroidales bacterium]MBN2757755.1 bifunctional UDP-3-O-[3-hydroxymyristoyl] N-acetylglucosamine deacetylase/3-hydroxyacyl-ACP dehydratase [Bacteroidales bacterium]
MADKQKTIAKPVSLEGVSLHTGLSVKITFKPAPENHGIIFKRIDLENQPSVRALVENVVDTSRSTVIEENGARVGTIEHVLSAAYGMEIDNLLIEINAPETPILDGSAKSYIDSFLKAGIVEQNADKEYFVVTNNINYADEENGIELMTFPDDNFSLNVMIDYNSSVLGNQYATLNSLSEYKDEIAECKTFVFLRELEFLLKNNLIKGGSLDNAIVIIEKETTQDELDRLADLFNKPRVPVKSRGVLNDEDLIFPNEPARHKLLDLLGDLALIGMPIKGKILATRPGHASNVEFAKKIKSTIKKMKSKNYAPVYDHTIPPFYTINDIKKILPHRPPFLLVDKIIKMDKLEVVGLKNVTINESFFIGHFPEEPVMPGVLIIEAMAQTGGILVLGTVPDPENYLTYFMKIDKVKFKRKVVPGDTLIFKLELTSPIRRGIANMKGQAFVGENIVAEGEFMAQITKEK